MGNTKSTQRAVTSQPSTVPVVHNDTPKPSYDELVVIEANRRIEAEKQQQIALETMKRFEEDIAEQIALAKDPNHVTRAMIAEENIRHQIRVKERKEKEEKERLKKQEEEILERELKREEHRKNYELRKQFANDCKLRLEAKRIIEIQKRIEKETQLCTEAVKLGVLDENGVPTPDKFMDIHKELMKLAREDLLTKKENPEVFNRIINYAMRVIGGGCSPNRRRGYIVYGMCLGCQDMCQGSGHWLPEFQEIGPHRETTTIPHNYVSILKHSSCAGKGRGLCGRNDSGFIPCWFNE